MTRRLWILNHYAAGPEATTGTRHYDIGRGLARLGWEVTVFASSFDHSSNREMHLKGRELSKEEVHDGVRFVWLRTLPYRGNGWRRVTNMISYVAMVLCIAWRRQPPDAVIGSSVHPFAAWAGYVLAVHFGARFYFEVRDLWPQTLIDLGEMSPNSLGVRLLARLEKFLYARAGRILTVLPRADQYIVGLGFDKDKVVYLPNGVDLDRYDAATRALPSEIETALEHLRGKFVVAYIGAHGTANHLQVIVDSAHVLQSSGDVSIHFLLIGDGPEKPKLQRMAKTMGLRNLTFLPPVKKCYIPSVLKLCHAGVFCLVPSPLYKYGISLNKIFDYMAAGLPIAATGAEGGDLLAVSQSGVMHKEDDVEGLSSTLRSWAADPEAAAELGRRGRRYCEEMHSTVRLASILDSVLRTNGTDT